MSRKGEGWSKKRVRNEWTSPHSMRREKGDTSGVGMGEESRDRETIETMGSKCDTNKR